MNLKKLVGRFHELWSAVKYEKSAILGSLLVISMSAIALAAPFMSPYDPDAISDKTFHPPSIEHLMGTDNLGRDILSRVLWGTRVSIVFGFGAAIVSLLIGSVLGLIAGYYGTWVDNIISRLIEILLTIPATFLMIVVVSLIGQNILFTMLIVALLYWPSNGRIARAQAISIKNLNYIQSLTVMGASSLRIIFLHVFPNSLGPIVANSTLQIGRAIIWEATLGFLGLSDPNLVSWGRMIDIARRFPYHWWIGVFPGIFIVLCVLGFNIAGDGFQNVFNPQSKRR
jgi:peptide/nickel transport system permease protein